MWPTASDRGAWAEHLVVADLMQQGYYVFRAESSAAPFDLVAYNGEQLIRIEVKCAGRGNNSAEDSWHCYVKYQDRFDWLALVFPDGQVRYSPGDETIVWTGRTTFYLKR